MLGLYLGCNYLTNCQHCSDWLQNERRGWPMQIVIRLEICTMQKNFLLL